MIHNHQIEIDIVKINNKTWREGERDGRRLYAFSDPY